MEKIILSALIILCGAMRVYASPITDPNQLSPNPTIIDFEDVNTGGALLTSLPNPATFGDVTFASLTGTLSIFDISLAGWSADGTEVASKTLFPGGEPDSAIVITFTNPVAEFLLGWGDPNFPGNVLRAYDANGTLLEEASVALGPPGNMHAAWIGFKRSTADIAKIIVQPDQSLPSGDDYVIDNIYYNAAGAICGDQVVDKDTGEQCDDGNTVSGDGCSDTCQTEIPLPQALFRCQESINNAGRTFLTQMLAAHQDCLERQLKGNLALASDCRTFPTSDKKTDNAISRAKKTLGQRLHNACDGIILEALGFPGQCVDADGFPFTVDNLQVCLEDGATLEVEDFLNLSFLIP